MYIGRNKKKWILLCQLKIWSKINISLQREPGTDGFTGGFYQTFKKKNFFFTQTPLGNTREGNAFQIIL